MMIPMFVYVLLQLYEWLCNRNGVSFIYLYNMAVKAGPYIPVEL